MLVLSRKLNEKIMFPSIGADVQVLAIKPGVVRLGIHAPSAVPVLREEVQQRSAEWATPCPQAPAVAAESSLQKLMQKRLKITSTGLDVLRRQLQTGLGLDALETLDRIAEDVELLRDRLEGGGSSRPSRRCPTRSALVVEDDYNERELLAGFLRMAGMEVATAGDGTDALDYLKARERPDVVLLDMGLPRCDGATAVREIRRNPALANLKIFAVSGHLPEEYNLDRGPTGIDGWFQKPIDPMVLLQDLNRELDRCPGMM